MKGTAKFVDPHADQRKSEADKIARLRAMRLAKEAAEKVAVEREAAEKAVAHRVHRVQRRRKRTSAALPSAE
jgi:hypothetical protein